MTPPPYRLAKARTLKQAGFVHVSGWVRAEDAPAIQRVIDETKPAVDAAIEERE